MRINTSILTAPTNEPVRSYTPGSPERLALQAELKRQAGTILDIPLVIGGREIRTGVTHQIRAPHDHSLVLGQFHEARAEEVSMAIDAAIQASAQWSRTPWNQRAAIFLKAAELASGKYKEALLASTMLGQSKNVHQAEIDAAAELIDFWRFNSFYMFQIVSNQDLVSPSGIWNIACYRPLEGFVLAVTPFNFTAIGGNLPTAPAIMGNVVLWKPASTAVLSAWYIMQILREAGLPDGVINFIPGPGRTVGDVVFDNPNFAGLHFTGSTGTFNGMWKRIGDGLAQGKYRTYPRIVGETGGKDFVLAAPDADVEALSVALFRGAFEYQGQKCSAASRAYVPRSIWPQVLQRLKSMASEIVVGDVADFKTFMGAVIDKSAFESITGYIEYARDSEEAEIVVGGNSDSEKGWFIDPTIVVTTNPRFRLMEEEIFGPVLTVYVYEDDKLDDTVQLVDRTSPYALTGAIFAKDRYLIAKLTDALMNAAGNFYINDKPTGAVVGQQPFGGARASGTNDKAGSPLNLLRWTSMRTIKETFVPPTDYKYPHMLDDK
jgi:1-pyrroline-5-carboxylate dehydrogenase